MLSGPLTLWMLGCCNFKNPGHFPSSQAEGDPETLLREFFQQNADANRPGHSDSSDAVMTWLGGHGNRADFRGSKECWRISKPKKMVEMPSSEDILADF